MAEAKGHAVVWLRKRLREIGPGAEHAVLAELSEDERRQYAQVQATEWVPMAFIEKIFPPSAPILWPSDPDPLVAMGRERARDIFTGVYRFIFRTLTAEFLATQAPKIWSLGVRNGGTALSNRLDARTHRFDIVEYPEMPEWLRVYCEGYVCGLLQMTGVEAVEVTRSGTPERWSWTSRW